MKRTVASALRKTLHDGLRRSLALLPRRWRFALCRAMVRCDPSPDPRLELKIAETRDELEACFRILHDAYVAAGFMQPDRSGLRVTAYHALPTTTTLCAKWEGRVVGTISIIREGVFGFPLQSVFDLSGLRALGGQITEVSSLAVDPSFRKTGGMVLFPLMKFMREYAKFYFDTRHLVIAVNPNKIELYEALLCFDRLQSSEVDSYDFANGAPAVGATLDLQQADARTEPLYRGRSAARNLYRYLYVEPLANIRWPTRQFHTTNDPVLTPAMLDYFFNQRTQVFAGLDDRQRLLLRSIYDHPAYAGVLPVPSALAPALTALRRHRRFSIRCPARLRPAGDDSHPGHALQVIELSRHGFQAESGRPLAEGQRGWVEVELGPLQFARVEATVVRRHDSGGMLFCGFSVADPDPVWLRCVAALEGACTHADLPTAGVTLPALPATAQRTGAAGGAEARQRSVAAVGRSRPGRR